MADGKKEDKGRDEKHRKYVRALSKEEKMLLSLREMMYHSSWDEMRKDLNDRLNQKPYIFKIAHNIEEDLLLIEKLENYETKHGISLSDFVEEE